VFIGLATSERGEPATRISQCPGTTVFARVEKVRPYADSLKTLTSRNLQGKNIARIYVIRVIDGTSRRPVPKASVTVELASSSKTKWEGRTDSEGVFAFTWEVNTGFVKGHIVVQAPGFWTVDDYNVVVEERIIPLKKED
jgi:hypothetical protein